MAIDLELIRRKVAELNGQKQSGGSNGINYWKEQKLGTHIVRGLPWKNSPEGLPFMELWFYYFKGHQGFLAPHQFGKPDPVNDFMRQLYSSGKPEDKALAKNLYSKMRSYMALIVRGEEDKGVQVWAFGKGVYEQLLSNWTDPEGPIDILDPSKNGYDLTVTITQKQGKDFKDFAVKAGRTPRPLSDDPEQVKKWLEAVPNMLDAYPVKSAAEIETILHSWLDAGAPSQSDSDGTVRRSGGDNSSENKNSSAAKLDALAKEVATPVKKAVVPKAKAAPTPTLDEDEPPAKKSIDDAFNELMSDD